MKYKNSYKGCICHHPLFQTLILFHRYSCLRHIPKDILVRLSDIEGDYYTFDAPNYCAVGKNTGQEYRMGDEVKIKVLRADLVKKQLDFELI